MTDTPQPDNRTAVVAAALNGYIDAVRQLFLVGDRRLADQTPVTELSESEYGLLTGFLSDAVEPRNRTCFRAVYELPPDANPYVVAFLLWLGYLEGIAAESGRAPIFAAPATAGAYLNWLSLSVLKPVEFVCWGDIANIRKHKPEMLDGAIIIGDLDHHKDPKQRSSLSSGDGMISADETAAAIAALARSGRTSMILFHRAGALSAFNLTALTAAINAEVPPPGVKKSGCFVATACCGAADHPTVLTLRAFRDRRLHRHRAGRAFIRWYEWMSPPLAAWLERHAVARTLVRDHVLSPLAQVLALLR